MSLLRTPTAAVFLALLATSYAASLPKAIRPCKVDADLNSCAVQRANEAWPTLVKGDPTRSIPVLDPFLVAEMKSENGNGNFRLGLIMNKARFKGFKSLEVEECRFDLKKKRLEFVVFVPQLNAAGRYKMDGVLLVLPVQGSGPFNLTAIGLRMWFKLDYTLEKKSKDIQLMKVVKTEMSHHNVTNMSGSFENLFNGNKQLSDTLNAVIRENWQELVQVMGPPFAQVATEVTKSVLEAILGSVPYNDIFLF